MKSLTLLVLAMGAVMAMAAGSVLAADEAAAPAAKPAPKAEARAGIAMQLDQLGLTDDQKAQIKAILQAAAEQAKQAPDIQAKLQIFKDALEKIQTTVLTDEQRAKVQQGQEQLKQKMEQLREKMKERRGQKTEEAAAAPQT